MEYHRPAGKTLRLKSRSLGSKVKSPGWDSVTFRAKRQKKVGSWIYLGVSVPGSENRTSLCGPHPERGKRDRHRRSRLPSDKGRDEWMTNERVLLGLLSEISSCI